MIQERDAIRVMTQIEKPRRFILSLVAGLLIVCNAVAVGVAGTYFPSIFPTLPGSDNNATIPFATIAIIGLISGVLVLFGAIMLLAKPANKKVWGAIVVVFSILSVIRGGGFIIGFILGILGGKSGFSGKSKAQPPHLKAEV